MWEEEPAANDVAETAGSVGTRRKTAGPIEARVKAAGS